MLSAALLIAGLVGGKIALASLGVAEWATLASAGFTVAKVAVIVGKDIEKKVVSRHNIPITKIGVFPKPQGGRHVVLCFQGAPSAQAARFCEE